MKKIEGEVRLNLQGCVVAFEFEMPDDATAAEIEYEAREAMYQEVEWSYTVDGEVPGDVEVEP